MSPDSVTSSPRGFASREVIPRPLLQRGLLMVLFALGTNMGIKRIVTTGEHGETEATLRQCAAFM